MSRNNPGIGLWERNLNDDTFLCSETAAKVVESTGRVFPASEPQLTWRDFLALIYPEDRQRVIDISSEHIATGANFATEFRIAATDNTLHWMRLAGQLEHDRNGAPVRIRGLIENISERKLAEQALRLTACVFTHIQEGALITDRNGAILDINPAFTRLTGYTHDEVLGKNSSLLRSEIQATGFYKKLWETLLDQGKWSGEIQGCKKDGSGFLEWLSISAVRNAADRITHFVGIFSDISPLKQHTSKLEQLAYYDPLTSIPNRLLLADRMHQAVAQTRRQNCLLAVGYLDLDSFKPVNDKFGHEMGDRLLIEISHRIGKTIREIDTVARLGGDEFAFLLLGLENMEQCSVTLQRILDSIARPITLGENSVEVSASIGVSLFPLDDADPDTLLRHADQAMYQAKQLGKNRFQIYDSALELNIRTHGEVLNRVKYALENDELIIHYQPKISLRSGEIAGVEALIRWQHPDCGMVLPTDFLPLLHGNILAQTIDRWVMEQAMRQMLLWSQQGLELEVSINLGVHTLQCEDFINFLSSLLQRYPTVRPELYQLEILETTGLPLEDVDFISRTMRDCMKLGVHFALDDFGTGYSSLTFLKHLPAQSIKIDQSFIHDMLEDNENLAIVQSITELARAFRKQTVAEGVETEAQGRQLLRMGCDQVQGFGISEPIAPEKLPDWIKNWRAPDEWKRTDAVSKS